MGDIPFTVTERVTGEQLKQPLTPAISGVLGADWQRLATRAKQAENDMREVAEAAPVTSVEHNVRGAAKDIIGVSQRERQEAYNIRRKREANNSRPKQPAVPRTITPQRPKSKKNNDMEMEF